MRVRPPPVPPSASGGSVLVADSWPQARNRVVTRRSGVLTIFICGIQYSCAPRQKATVPLAAWHMCACWHEPKRVCILQGCGRSLPQSERIGQQAASTMARATPVEATTNVATKTRCWRTSCCHSRYSHPRILPHQHLRFEPPQRR